MNLSIVVPDVQNCNLHHQYNAAAEHLNFTAEVEHYLKIYPHTEHVDICLHDLNGHARGKRIHVSQLRNLAHGCYFPLSVYAMSLEGQVIEDSGLGKCKGEPDQLCLPILGSLRPCADAPELHAQLYLSMQTEDGQDCMLEPRNLLKKILNDLHHQHYFPVIAGEIEFYLFEQSTAEPSHKTLSQSFDLDAPMRHQPVLEQIETEARRQKIDMTALVAESSSCQYEINIQHSSDLLKLCDDMMAMKRIVRQVAAQHALYACFMAKPDMQLAGNGLHFHMSLLNQQQQNVFSSRDLLQPSPVLCQVIDGLIDLMPASMAILAPNINSFRRLQSGDNVCSSANWGVNNRNVAIRLPCAQPENHRLEYRVPGGDANPYLCITMMLTGVLHGLSKEKSLTDHNHNIAPKPSDTTHLLPDNQKDALQLFSDSLVLRHWLGNEFVQLWSACKYAEYQQIQQQMTQQERLWGL